MVEWTHNMSPLRIIPRVAAAAALRARSASLARVELRHNMMGRWWSRSRRMDNGEDGLVDPKQIWGFCTYVRTYTYLD